MKKDFLEQALHVDDEVVYLQEYGKSSSTLLKGRIERITDKCVFMTNGRRKNMEKIVRINKEMFLLKVRSKHDINYEPVGLFSSAEAMEDGKEKFLKQQIERGFNRDYFEFIYDRYDVDKLA